MFQSTVLLITLSVTLTFAFRLPNNTRPETYEVNIRTWIHEGYIDFTGFVKIGIIALESTNSITLHHRLLAIQNVKVSSYDGTSILIAEPSYNALFELFTIPVVETNLTSGNRYFVEISYSGEMHYSSGFFYSYYINDSGDIRLFGSTQFETTHARRAFPCYDEPALKANFTICITHDPSYSAISNMPVVSQIRK